MGPAELGSSCVDPGGGGLSAGSRAFLVPERQAGLRTLGARVPGKLCPCLQVGHWRLLDKARGERPLDQGTCWAPGPGSWALGRAHPESEWGRGTQGRWEAGSRQGSTQGGRAEKIPTLTLTLPLPLPLPLLQPYPYPYPYPYP